MKKQVVIIGSGQVYEEMANKVKQMGGQIILNANVSKIKVNKNNKISKVIYTKNNKQISIEPDICISSIVSWHYELKEYDGKYLKNKISSKFSNIKNLYIVCDEIKCSNYQEFIHEVYLTPAYNSEISGYNILSIYKVNK